VEVPNLKQGPYLIASIQSAQGDEDLVLWRDSLVAQAGQLRSRGVIADVTALNVCNPSPHAKYQLLMTIPWEAKYGY
jgi:hypothetical protein